jgi:flagellar biosynthetic protein FlhB
MADEDKDSKTEEASGKRLSDAHAKGQFARSPEIAVVFLLAAALGGLSLTVGTAAQEVSAMARNTFAQLSTIQLQLDTVPMQLGETLMLLGKVLMPVLGACALAALLAGGLQSGFNLTPEVLGLKLEKLNPVPGFQRLFSKQVLVHAGIDLLKLVSIGLVLWVAAKGFFEDPLFSAPVEAVYLGHFLKRSTFEFLSRLVLCMGVIAAISYWYELMKSKKDLMMTKQEVKEEHKQSEGDAQTKGAMRRMARRLLQKQMLAAVPTADVIVTNPTHYAVALKYERGVDQAPVILAKGENRFALRIKALAAEHGVPVVENKPVARMLYSLGTVGEAIPGDLYQAVAQILAFVYRTHRYYFHRLKSRRVEAARAAA